MEVQIVARRVAWLATLALASASAGCAARGPPALPDPPADLRAEPAHGRIAARIRVIGRVIDGEGKPQAGARVRMHAHPRSLCRGGRGAWDETVSRPDGWFLRTLYFYSLVRTRSCVSVWAELRVGSSVARDSISDLLADFLERGAVDTVRVQLVLRP